MILTGLARLGRDAAVRYTPDNTPVTNLSLAFNYGRRGEDGNRSTQWVDASLFGQRAEKLAQYLTKGTLVDVVLEDPHIEDFEGKNGAGHKLAARIVSIEFAGGGQERQPQQQVSQNRQSENGRNEYARQSGREPQRQQGGRNNHQDYDDDIPF